MSDDLSGEQREAIERDEQFYRTYTQDGQCLRDAANNIRALLDENESLRARLDEQTARAENNEQMWLSHKETVEIQARQINDLTAKLAQYVQWLSDTQKQNVVLQMQLTEAQATIARLEQHVTAREVILHTHGAQAAVAVKEYAKERDQLQATATAQADEVGRLREALEHCQKVFRSMSDRGAYPVELLPFDPASHAHNPLFMGKQGYIFIQQALTAPAAGGEEEW